MTRVDDERDFYHQIFRTGATEGLPIYYFDAGMDTGTTPQRQIIVSPTPDRSITLNVHYYANWTTEELSTTELSDDLAKHQLPIQYHNTVWKGGLYYFLRSFDDPAMSLAFQDYTQALAQIDRLQNVNLDSPASFKMGKQVLKKY